MVLYLDARLLRRLLLLDLATLILLPPQIGTLFSKFQLIYPVEVFLEQLESFLRLPPHVALWSCLLYSDLGDFVLFLRDHSPCLILSIDLSTTMISCTRTKNRLLRFTIVFPPQPNSLSYRFNITIFELQLHCFILQILII